MEGSGANTRVVFSKDEVEQLRKHIRAYTHLTEALYKECMHRKSWDKCPLDPMKVFEALEGKLWVKHGYTLRAYHYGGTDANSLIFASKTDHPFPYPVPAWTFLGIKSINPRLPSGALTDFMKVIEGDHTPWSYFVASLLKRELEELGNTWHFVNWGTHVLLLDPPEKYRDAITLGDEKLASIDVATLLHWVQPRPKEWLPIFEQHGGLFTIVFYSYSGRWGGVFKHIDEYTTHNYEFNSKTTLLARSDVTYMF